MLCQDNTLKARLRFVFCIVNENQSFKRKQLFRYENEEYFYYVLYCKKFSERIKRRLSQKLGCPIVYSTNIDSNPLKEKVLENLAVYYLKKTQNNTVLILNNNEPNEIITRIINLCKEIHLVNCGDIVEADYLNRFGYAPVRFDKVTDENVVLKYGPLRLYVNATEILLDDEGFILPSEVAELLPDNLPQLDFLYLLWKYSDYNPDALLPGNITQIWP